jgi:hypothetical protein
MFRLVSKNESHLSNGTHRQGEIMISPALVVKAFGPPNEDDGYKVSGSYVFQNTETGEVFTLYDWKMTDLYFGSGPSPEELWSSEEEVQLNIGGKTDCFEFKQKLKEHIEWIKLHKPFETEILEIESPAAIIALPEPNANRKNQ